LKAAGLPVVAAKRGALPEIAANSAVLLNSDDPAEWAEALHQVITDEAARTSLRTSGRRRAEEFTWERTASLTAAVYREVLER